MGRESMHLIRSFARWIARQSERGASLIEYALLVALIAVVMIGAIEVLGGSALTSLERSNASIAVATS